MVWLRVSQIIQCYRSSPTTVDEGDDLKTYHLSLLWVTADVLVKESQHFPMCSDS